MLSARFGYILESMKVEKNQNLELLIKIWRFEFYLFLENLENLAEFRPPKTQKKKNTPGD
jgi:hypothetical protein